MKLPLVKFIVNNTQSRAMTSTDTAQKMKFFIKDFSNKRDQICSFREFGQIYWRNP